MPDIDPLIAPFSRFGSYFSIATVTDCPQPGKGRYLRSNRGDRLPPDVREALVTRIRSFLTPWGLATEHRDRNTGTVRRTTATATGAAPSGRHQR